VVRLWGRPASACKPYRIKLIKSNQKSRFLRAAEAVGLGFLNRFKLPSFSKYNVFQIRRMRFGAEKLHDAIANQALMSTDMTSSCALTSCFIGEMAYVMR
jgi:hypothetical protein